MNVAAIMLFLSATVGCPGAEQEDVRAAFTPIAAQARDVWRRIGPPVSERALNAIVEARANVQKYDEPSALGRAIIQYLIARLTVLSGEKDVAESQFVAASGAAMAVENVLGLFELHGDSGERRALYTGCLSDLLPVSSWRTQIDGGQSVFDADIKPPRADVPATDRKKMLEAAASLEQAGLYDLAWRAYAEAVYASFSPAWIKEKLEETWLSPAPAEYWAKAAQCAYKAGKQELAWDYLTKAAVLGTDKLYEEAQATAKEWSAVAELRPTPAQPVDPNVKREALTKAVRLYAELNAHPRALALIEANRAVFEDPDRLRKEIEEQWLAVVKDMSRAARKVTLYGYEVYPNGDPLKVRIPWALSDEAMASVRERLQAASAQPTPKGTPGQPQPGPSFP